MESDPRDALLEAQRAAERGEAAPYVDFPPTPAWFPPAGGLWAGALVTAIASAGSHERLAILGIMVLLVVQVLFMKWYSRHHGALPSPQGAPPEFVSAFRRYKIGVAVVLAATTTTWVLLGPWWAALTTAVLVTIGLMLYEKAYAAAAARTRERLA